MTKNDSIINMDTTLRLGKKQRIAFIEAELTRGETLAAVGRKLGISRERVRQIARQFGVPKFIRPRKPRYVPLDWSKRLGCSKKERDEIVDECLAAGLRNPYMAFLEQRTRAKKRDIEWEMNFAEWWDIWKEHYANRGPRKTQLVMCRYLDRGPYRPDNVRIDYACSNGHEKTISGRYKSRRAQIPSKSKAGYSTFSLLSNIND